MKLLKAEVQNFGSYSNLTFDFQNKGLALLHGATGSGKSTFQDIPMWALFGTTAKDGNVDEIKSWNGNNGPTWVILNLKHNDKEIRITRVRGNPSQNDLSYTIDNTETIYRGKDITETQRHINELLGFDAYTYTLAAYYNEFSPTGTFFTDPASKRKLLAETLVNLDMPMRLLSKLALIKKDTKSAEETTNNKLNKVIGQIFSTEEMLKKSTRSLETWDIQIKETIKNIQILGDNFETDKLNATNILSLKSKDYEDSRLTNIETIKKQFQTKIDNFLLENKCLTCGTIRVEDEDELERLHDDLAYYIKKELTAYNPYTIELDRMSNTKNHYYKQVEVEKSKENPFVAQITSLTGELQILLNRQKELEFQASELEHKLVSLTQLHKLTDQLRGELLKNSVQMLEGKVNRYLETYFDAEMRVGFSIQNGDKLDINIWKSGHECSYKQLSKGQRGLLKLCFSVSVMESVSNKIGVCFDTIMLDESLDGLDTSLKIKAFSLFQELEKTHNSIFVIEHSNDFQTLFDNQYHVTLENDESKIS